MLIIFHMDTNFIIATAIGFIALCVTVSSFQRKEARQIFFVQIFSPLLWALHFFLLGAWAGCVINVLNSFKNIGITFINDTLIKKFAMIYIVILWFVFWIFVYQTPSDLTLLLSNTLGSLLIFTRDNRYIVARGNILIALLWFTYGLINNSIPSVLTEIFILSSIIIGMIRHEAKPFKLFKFK